MNDKRPQMTSITLQNEYGTYQIMVPKNLEHIGEYVDDLIVPVLLAAGFHQKLIDEYLFPE
jgi:hypothetical protein